jgi:hypothetical protein
MFTLSPIQLLLPDPTQFWHLFSNARVSHPVIGKGAPLIKG